MKKINFLFLFFLGFYLNGYCQSKKEQIEILTFQNDSLRNLLSKNSESFEIEKNYLNSKINKNNTKIAELNSEIAQLNSRNLELKNTNSNYAEEVSILKNQVLSLNKKLDSISNLKYGELLQPKPDTDETSDDCIYNYYYNESTIELPQNIKEISAGGISFVDILPVGWSKEGLFAYNWVAQSECGMCSVGLSLFDARTNTELPSHDYNLESIGGDMGEENTKCNILQVIKADKQKEFSNHSITPISELKMNYKKSSDGSLFIDGILFKIEKSSDKARLVSKNAIGEKKVLHEEKLKKEYNSEYEQWCQDDVEISGCFYNPLNPGQLIIHLYYIVPCGFEHEDEYSSFFISVNL